jgi:hypothetical protein
MRSRFDPAQTACLVACHGPINPLPIQMALTFPALQRLLFHDRCFT